MRVARREFLGSAVLLATAGRASAAADENLDYRDGVLRWPGGLARAAGGRAGVSANKKEGDGATPAGTFALVSAFFRADRMSPPRSGLPLRALLPSDAWVDDPVDPNYNRLVSLPYPGHTEPLWLDDPVYDLLVVIGYNMAPVVPGPASAIAIRM
jgi:L,D-peptidoglycan transpeptidase YkuD (ErfK/YbiS/YcfS/YnhG family)